ncbi:MAG: glycosyl transferase [Candidatus Moranbacteria bacterium RIFOXYB1_FULL_43_19]|nr:MAG: glycosyl transferase [Candidatus Moranbacteria bacterium RIFOXYB1_FULL_43_19]OGI27422.1 MAG: glycosyl transferase [Candidatus Moranbacteria bacterium RIFOXYA1_FULL_44_7]OGI33033.1 MAG: glycosyl transferase [Candidatus Moranbacteria bacterium RIFOXYC1_FULL_44_13]OGI38226.1 MAG: glycosyl transferase [Candidatus Moranbacteria bacterium RIFOXYD1_FULL_44_12]
MEIFRKISIVIPIYNEERTLEKIISAVEKADVFHLEKEIILVNDCSRDKSKEILEKYEGRHKILHHKKNRGKGAALKTGFENATGDIVLIQDADLEYDPNEYADIIKPILDGKADVVFSSRFLSHRPHRVLYHWHYVGNNIITTFSNIFTNLNLTDIESGYKVFTKEILRQILPKLKSKRFGIEPELVARFAKLSKRNKCRVYEVGISYSGRTYAEGKKIGWIDGIEAVWCIIKYNLFSK